MSCPSSARFVYGGFHFESRYLYFDEERAALADDLPLPLLIGCSSHGEDISVLSDSLSSLFCFLISGLL